MGAEVRKLWVRPNPLEIWDALREATDAEILAAALPLVRKVLDGNRQSIRDELWRGLGAGDPEVDAAIAAVLRVLEAAAKEQGAERSKGR